jgi:release factor glutamine methyltransferase
MNKAQVETIREALFGASRLFELQGVRAPLYDAEQLLLDLLGMEKAQLLREWGRPFPEEMRAEWESRVRRRASREPLQYILGVQEFYGRAFRVSPAVLIPRPETELLVEEVLKRRERFPSPPLIVDIGTGSGAIALTLACEWPDARVVAVDLSPDALAVAAENAGRLGVAERVAFVRGDLVEPLLERGVQPAIVVSNPPYIPSKDCRELEPEVREHEPMLALDGGEDGLYPYRVISAALPRLWGEQRPALVAYEVGQGQAQDVAAMIRQAVPDVETLVRPDLAGIERVVLGWRD